MPSSNSFNFTPKKSTSKKHYKKSNKTIEAIRDYIFSSSKRGEKQTYNDEDSVSYKEKGRKTFLERMRIFRRKENVKRLKVKEKNKGLYDDYLEEISQYYDRKDAVESMKQKEREIEDKIERTRSKSQKLKLRSQLAARKTARKLLEQLSSTEQIKPTDFDFMIIALFAMIIDSIDIFLTALQIITAFTVGELISGSVDIIAMLVIGLWMFVRTRNKVRKRKDIIKKAEGKIGRRIREMRIQKMMTSSATRRVFLRIGIVFLGELIPLIGLIPWWTIAVFSTLRDKK